jgi:hypothetical protein
MNKMLSAALILVATCASAEQTIKPPANQRNFVACPMVMETEPVPCFVAEYEGERYFLAVQSGRGGSTGEDRTIPPQLLHKALVEGTLSDEPRICGGIVLKPVKVSVIEDTIDPSCNTVLPSQGYHANGPRAIGLDGDPPGPRKSTAINESFGARPGYEERVRMYNEKARNREPMSFVIGYLFDSTYLMYPVEQEQVEDAFDYAKLVQASRIEIRGYRGAAVLSNGEVLTEKESIAEARATKLADIMLDFGWPKDKLVVRWSTEPQHRNGVGDYELRRTVIDVIP